MTEKLDLTTRAYRAADQARQVDEARARVSFEQSVEHDKAQLAHHLALVATEAEIENAVWTLPTYTPNRGPTPAEAVIGGMRFRRWEWRLQVKRTCPLGHTTWATVHDLPTLGFLLGEDGTCEHQQGGHTYCTKPATVARKEG